MRRRYIFLTHTTITASEDDTSDTLDLMPSDPIISDEEMTHLKTLARLEIDPEETQRLKEDLNKILGYFEQIRQLDTDGVDELVRPMPSQNVFREDVVRPSLTQEEALNLAVEEEEGYFKVPRTVDADA